MKNILVIDVPMTDDNKHLCDKCPIWNDNLRICQYDMKTGHKDCPLKPLPQKCGSARKDDEVSKLIALGWNACIDYLEGKE